MSVPVRAYVCVAVALSAGYYVTPDSPLRTVLWTAIAFSTVVAVAVGVARHRPAGPLPWVLTAAGLMSYTAGEALFYWPQLVHNEQPVGQSLADVFYLAMYPLLAAGLTILVRRQSPGGDRAALLDASIITVGVALLTWVFLIRPYLDGAGGAGGSVLDRLTAVAYPLGDVLVLAVLARLGSGRTARSTSFRLLLASLLALLAADGIYTWQSLHGHFRAGSWVDVGWILFYTGVGCAALHPDMRRLSLPVPAGPARLSSGRFAVLLAVAALLIPAVITVESTQRGELAVYLAASGVLFVLILIRMADLMAVLREVQRQRAEGRFQRLTEQVTDVLSICGRDARLQYVTPSVTSLLGYRPEALIGTSLLDLVHPDDRDRAMVLFSDAGAVAVQTGRIVPLECRLRHVNGQYVITETAGRVVDDADVAMHMAKRQGRNRYAYFAPSMHAGLLEKLDLADELRGAVERQELLVYYQPFVDLSDGTVVGAEALVRWPHPTKGFIPPDRFIPIAEESGLILPLGYAVLEAACRQAAEWAALCPGLKISVNLSPRQVQDPAVLLYVQQTLARSGLPPHLLTLEITESLLREDAEVAQHRLGELKALGVQLAVDDFGTGYSSLSRLHDFPIDVLKIPKPFVDGVAEGAERSALARAILDLAAALGLGVVAEGVEHPEQARELHRLGCPVGQGFHFSRPVPAPDFGALLTAPAPAGSGRRQ
ncbi:EAL domain-containing protein [Dactylosporangium sp. NPDC050688]|uniref:bifunctional diguanylate cyclase/phosphodiesterase n=1 Tax=Dactylosporangium sp. NPDC050688 TaxID=3157217 RepID=UPI0033F4199C